MKTDALLPVLVTVGLTVQANDHPASVGFVAEVTVKEQGVPTVAQPVFTMTGSGPFRSMLSARSFPRLAQPVPGTAEASTLVVRRTRIPSALNVVRGTLNAGIVPTVAEPFALRTVVLLASITSHLYVTGVPAPAGRSFASPVRIVAVKTALGLLMDSG